MIIFKYMENFYPSDFLKEKSQYYLLRSLPKGVHFGEIHKII